MRIIRCITALLVLILFTTDETQAQRWSGSDTTEGAIYRKGNVGIGTASPPVRLVSRPSNPRLMLFGSDTKARSSRWIDHTAGKLRFGKTALDTSSVFAFFDADGRLGINMPSLSDGPQLQLGGSFVTFKNGHHSDAAVAAPNIWPRVESGFSSEPAYTFWYQAGTGISNPGRNELGLVTKGSERVRVTREGRIGIGVASPAEDLHISSTPGTNTIQLGRASYIQESDSKRRLFLGANIHDDENDSWVRQSSTHGAAAVDLLADDGGWGSFLRFSVDDEGTSFPAERMRVTSAGRVGIGTKQPQSLLAVDGTITTKEVIVTEADWADFVFEEGYDLPSLEEVEAHIGEQGHLPDVPSAKEVEENGVKVGEMNATLLQKIEELTLYAIEREKETRTLRREAQHLRAALSELQERVADQRRRAQAQQSEIDALRKALEALQAEHP